MRSGSIGTSSWRTIAWKLRDVSASRPALTISMATPSLRDAAHVLSQNPTSSGYEYGSACGLTVVEAPTKAIRSVCGGFLKAISGPRHPNAFVRSPDG